MEHIADHTRAIPKAPLYVLSNDSFMSGWGEARGMTNTCVVPVSSYAEAQKVITYIESRSDQKRVRTATRVAKSKRHVLFSNLEDWRKMAGLQPWP